MDYFIQPHFHSAQSYAPGCLWSPWHSIKLMNERFFFWNSFWWFNSTQLKFFSFWLDLMYCPCAHLCLCRKSTISQGWARSAAKTRWPGTWTGCSSSSPETTTSSPEPGASLESRFLAALCQNLFFSPPPIIVPPSDATVLVRSFSDFQAYIRAKKNKTYICKPDTGCQGKGIFITRSTKDIQAGEHMICQVYISRVRSRWRPHAEMTVHPLHSHICRSLSAAFHHRRIQVWLAYLRSGDVVRPVQDIHVQRGTRSLLHHQVHRPDQQQRGKRHSNGWSSVVFILILF